INTTGVISGTIAATAGRPTPYAVTVTASDGSHTASQTFNWTVNPVRLTTPVDQFNVPGDSVSLPVPASEGNGHALPSSATGLPSGLPINATSGTTSGSPASGAARDLPYLVTVTASNGTQSASAAFNWSVRTLLLTVPSPQTVKEGGPVSVPVQ